MNSKSLADMRISYTLDQLGDRDVLADPIAQFALWFEEIAASDVVEANALILATTGADGVPQARTLLMKSFDADGLVIYTNYDSAKGQQIAENPNVCALFYWGSRQRQVRWTGVAEQVSAEESDAYFAVRPRGSRLGALASHQSSPIADRGELQSAYERLEAAYSDDKSIPRPANWGGYRIRPTTIEFWQGRENRLHDRILFTRAADDTWQITRLAP